MARHPDKLRPQAERRLARRSVQAPGLEGAGGIHAPLQYQMGGLPAQPQGASGNRQRGALAERDQARQLGIAASVGRKPRAGNVTERTMKNEARDELAAPETVDRSTFQ